MSGTLNHALFKLCVRDVRPGLDVSVGADDGDEGELPASGAAEADNDHDLARSAIAGNVGRGQRFW